VSFRSPPVEIPARQRALSTRSGTADHRGHDAAHVRDYGMEPRATSRCSNAPAVKNASSSPPTPTSARCLPSAVRASPPSSVPAWNRATARAAGRVAPRKPDRARERPDGGMRSRLRARPHPHPRAADRRVDDSSVRDEAAWTCCFEDTIPRISRSLPTEATSHPALIPPEGRLLPQRETRARKNTCERLVSKRRFFLQFVSVGCNRLRVVWPDF